jgi:hypothetical protein
MIAPSPTPARRLERGVATQPAPAKSTNELQRSPKPAPLNPPPSSLTFAPSVSALKPPRTTAAVRPTCDALKWPGYARRRAHKPPRRLLGSRRLETLTRSQSRAAGFSSQPDPLARRGSPLSFEREHLPRRRLSPTRRGMRDQPATDGRGGTLRYARRFRSWRFARPAAPCSLRPALVVAQAWLSPLVQGCAGGVSWPLCPPASRPRVLAHRSGRVRDSRSLGR